MSGLELKARELGASVERVKMTESAAKDKLEARISSRLEQSLVQRQTTTVSPQLRTFEEKVHPYDFHDNNVK